MVTRSLRADEPRTAPADEIAVRVTQRSTSPVTAGAGNWIWRTVALVHDVAGGRSVGRVSACAIGDRAADNGATDHARCNARADRAAIATSFCGGRGTQATRSQHGGGRKREYRLLHRSSLQVRSAAPTADSESKLPSPRAEIETDPICRKFVWRPAARPAAPKQPGLHLNRGFFFLWFICRYWSSPNRRPARGRNAPPPPPRRGRGAHRNPPYP